MSLMTLMREMKHHKETLVQTLLMVAKMVINITIKRNVSSQMTHTQRVRNQSLPLGRCPRRTMSAPKRRTFALCVWASIIKKIVLRCRRQGLLKANKCTWCKFYLWSYHLVTPLLKFRTWMSSMNVSLPHPCGNLRLVHMS